MLRIVVLVVGLTACHSLTAPVVERPRCHWITVMTGVGPLQVPFCPAA